MPKAHTTYQCEYCTLSFPTYLQCLEHECHEHLHITTLEYQQWQLLKDKARSAGHTVSHTKNRETEKEFDDAVEALIAFETKYNLSSSV